MDLERNFAHSVRRLSMDKSSHVRLIKDLDFLKGLIILLSSANKDVVKEGLESLHFLLQNKDTHVILHSADGLSNAVSLAIKKFGSEDCEIEIAGKEVLNILVHVECSTKENNTLVYRPRVFVLCVEDLDKESCHVMKNVIISIYGVISVYVNVDLEQCTVKAYDFVTPQVLARVIYDRTLLEVKLLVRKDNGEKVQVPLLNKDENEEELPSYLPEIESPPKNRAISLVRNIQAKAVSVVDWFQQSFYW